MPELANTIAASTANLLKIGVWVRVGGDAKIPHMVGNVGELFVKCMRQVT